MNDSRDPYSFDELEIERTVAYPRVEVEAGNPDAPLPQPRKGVPKANNYPSYKERLKAAKSQEEKELIDLKQRKATHQRSLTRVSNQLKAKLKDQSNSQVHDEFYQELIDEIEEDESKDVVFKPNPGPQTDFLASDEDEVFYGGARGGGKTYSLLVDPIRFIHNKNFRGLFIRRTMPELRDIIHQTKQMYPKVAKGAKYKTQEHCWYFPSGARIEFGYAENIDDAERYRGQSYTWIGIDELPQYPDSDVYEMLKSSCRSADPELRTYMRSTGNPGNIGSAWVKEYFKIGQPKYTNKTFINEVKINDPLKNEIRVIKRTMKYIPAKVWDNPYLINDDAYVGALASMPETKRLQMLEGDWDALDDSAFPEFSTDIHVVEPFKIPHDWTKFRAADWGYSSPFCCLWFAIDYDENIYIYREYYGEKTLAHDWAKNVALLERGEQIRHSVIDGSTNISRGEAGPSIFEIINTELRKAGRPAFSPADRSPGSRSAGKQSVHTALSMRPIGLVDEEGEMIEEPILRIFNTCENLIRTLPILVEDDLDTEKVSKKQEDHCYDALHYGLRSRPTNPTAEMRNTVFRETNDFRPADTEFGY